MLLNSNAVIQRIKQWEVTLVITPTLNTVQTQACFVFCLFLNWRHQRLYCNDSPFTSTCAQTHTVHNSCNMNLTSLLGVQHKKLNIWASSLTAEKTVQIIIQLVLTRTVTYLKGASVSCTLKYITYCKHVVFELKVIRTPLCFIFFLCCVGSNPLQKSNSSAKANSSTSILFSSTLIDLVKEVGTVVSKTSHKFSQDIF